MDSNQQNPPEEVKITQEEPTPNLRKLNIKTLSNNVFPLKVSPNVRNLIKTYFFLFFLIDTN